MTLNIDNTFLLRFGSMTPLPWLAILLKDQPWACRSSLQDPVTGLTLTRARHTAVCRYSRLLLAHAHTHPPPPLSCMLHIAGGKKLLFYFYFVIVKQKFVNGLLITILTISQCFRQLLPAPRPQSCEDDDPFCAQDCQNCGHGHHQGLCAVCVPGH